MTRVRPGRVGTGAGPDAEFADRHSVHRGQTELLARHLACIVSWLAGATNFGSNRVDSARGRSTNVADQGGAPISIAAHAPQMIVDEFTRNARDVGVGLGREPWPLA